MMEDNIKDPKRVATGKKNRASGRAFELKVRKDLEKQNWVVAKWTNNVEFIPFPDATIRVHEITKNQFPVIEFTGKFVGKLIPAKHKFNPFRRAFAMGTGFPDFIAFAIIPTVTIRLKGDSTPIDYREQHSYDIQGVEVKSNGTLSKEEKDKCVWLLEHKIFNRILIARKGEKRGQIIYEEFKYDKI